MTADDTAPAEAPVALPTTKAHGDMPIETRMLARQVARAKRLHAEAMDRVAALTDELAQERKESAEALARLAKSEACAPTQFDGVTAVCRAVPGRDAVRMSVEVEGAVLAVATKSDKELVALYHVIGAVVKSLMSTAPFRPLATPHDHYAGSVAGVGGAFPSSVVVTGGSAPLPPPEEEDLYEAMEVDERDNGTSA